MFCLLRRRLSSVTVINPSQSQLLRPISSTTPPPPPPPQNPPDQSSSFTVSYLVNSCGLSPESALSASKKVRLKSPSKPDLVLHFFRNHGFSNTQIANLTTKLPLLLLANPQKTLLPKLEFLKQVGLPDREIANFLSTDPNFLFRSLERKIKPAYEYLKGLLGSDEKVAAAIKSSCSSWVLQFNLQRLNNQKVDILRKHGVSKENIVKLALNSPNSFSKSNDRFEELVRNVSERGFDPCSSMFVHAIDVLSGMKSDTLEAKMQLFRSYGWSEDDIASAIRKWPFCVSISEEKLKKGLDFFMNKLKWKSSGFVKYSNLLGLSLEKRVIPRWMVIQYLLSKRLIKDSINVFTVLKYTEAKFVHKFLVKYESKAPEILKLYQGKL
ncbi:hypothetical protein Scep_018911 [Stephania cephalantha]|uniref:Uncharacterized protein n=1 Tax=Stephania cephalantha TaxID=152367 RepID=A0AAP0IA06_9MAGN